MLTRTYQSSITGRSASIRRQRRRSLAIRLYCPTNGCASILELHPEGGIASCPICRFSKRID